MVTSFIGCRPLAYTIQKPKGMSTSVDCLKEGETITVKFAISPVVEGSDCQAVFEDGTPENLQIIVQNGAARISWKIGQDHISKLSIKPYKFKLMIPSGNYSISIGFQTTAQQIAAPFMFSFIRF
jgi:hypothetical protein